MSVSNRDRIGFRERFEENESFSKRENRHVRREKRAPMEIRSSLAKTFQRFAIPRSKSSIGSLTSNSMTTIDDQSEDLAARASSSTRPHHQSRSHHHHHHRPPPLSYNQNLRLTSQPNSTTTKKNKVNMSTRLFLFTPSSFFFPLDGYHST